MVFPISASASRPATPPTVFPTTVLASKAPATVISARAVNAIVGGLTPPPTLISPTVITEDPSGQTYNFGDAEDWRLDVPLGIDINGAVTIIGGRNGRIIGGKWLYTGAAPKTTAPDGGIIDLTPADVGGVTLVEGLHFDSDGIYMDHIRVKGSGFRAHELIIQNCYGEGLAGKASGVHADFVECFPGIDVVRLEQVTFMSAFAGIFLPYRGTNTLNGSTVKWGPKKLYLTRVNALVDDAIKAADPELANYPKRFFYLQDGKTAGVVHGAVHEVCELVEVYVQSWGAYAWWKLPFPTPNSAILQSILSGDGTYVTFPAGMNTTGRITEGPPPEGNHVVPANVGRNFSSPWPI